MTDEDRGNLDGPGDAELIVAVRDGDTAAFDLLYRRHVQAARRMAHGLTRDPADVDDLVAESFARMLTVLGSGGGPEVAFRPYLLTTMRNLFYDGVKRDRKVQVTDDLSIHEPGVPFVDTAVQKLELSLVSRAFAKLPERWQVVLWHTEVEGERPANVAPLLGMSPNGVAALAYRAREGLRQQYLQEHIANDPGEECQWATERLGAYVRSGLSSRERTRTEAHLTECGRCHLLFVELSEVNAGLRGALAPALLAGSAGGYLAAGAQKTVLLATWWTPVRRIAKRRSTQVTAASTALAGLVALVMVFVSQSEPVKPAVQAADPPRLQPAPPSTAAASASASVQPSPSVLPPAAPPPSPAESADLAVTLEPVGTLVRGRPATLAFTVLHRGTLAAARNASVPQGGLAFGPRGAVRPSESAVQTGPLTALITMPSGVTLRTGSPGDGWQCTAATAPSGVVCRRSSLASGQTSRAFVPVDISGSASDGTLRVHLTAPFAAATSSTALGKIAAGGLAASFAAILPATVVTGANTLMTCPLLALGCLAARQGQSILGRIDNGDYYLSGYSDPAAPKGTPSRAWVSGATIPVRAKVLWAGLYWSGSGSPPPNARAHLWVPGKGFYETVKASRIDRVSRADFSQPAYQASAEVTSLVQGTGGGSWWLAVDENAFASGYGSYGGWALVLVVQDDGPLRTVTVLDGYLPMRGSQTVSTAIYGTPGAAATIAFLGWEGDRGLAGDQLKLGGQPIGGAFVTNIAASHANGTSAGWNTFGVDARLIEGRIPPAPGEITATDTDDAWILATMAIASLAEP